jgi:hypothetical protein
MSQEQAARPRKVGFWCDHPFNRRLNRIRMSWDGVRMLWPTTKSGADDFLHYQAKVWRAFITIQLKCKWITMKRREWNTWESGVLEKTVRVLLIYHKRQCGMTECNTTAARSQHPSVSSIFHSTSTSYRLSIHDHTFIQAWTSAFVNVFFRVQDQKQRQTRSQTQKLFQDFLDFLFVSEYPSREPVSNSLNYLKKSRMLGRLWVTHHWHCLLSRGRSFAFLWASIPFILSLRLQKSLSAFYQKAPDYSSASKCRQVSNCPQVSNCRHPPKSDTSENLGVSQNGNVDRTWVK